MWPLRILQIESVDPARGGDLMIHLYESHLGGWYTLDHYEKPAISILETTQKSTSRAFL